MGRSTPGCLKAGVDRLIPRVENGNIGEDGYNVRERERPRGAPRGLRGSKRVRKTAARKEPKRGRMSRMYGTIGAFRSQRLAVNN
jgi:hypothetical protein